MEFDFRKYFGTLFKWWWLLVVGAIIPTTISNYYLSRQPKVYQAQVILMVGTTLQSSNPSGSDIALAQRLARGYAEMVRYRPVTGKVIEKLGLQRSSGQLAGQISTSLRPEANLLAIQVTDADPQLAAMIANALAETLIEQTPGAQTQGEQQRFVERQLVDLKAKIEKLEEEMEELQAKLESSTSAAEIKAAQDDLTALDPVVSRYRTEYALYLQSYVGSSVNELTVVEPAVAPGWPVGGRRMLTLGISGAAGVGVALAGVFLVEYLDDTLKWEARDETLVGLPMLGGVGQLMTTREAMLNRPDERSPGAESLRILRANVLLHRLRHPFQTILVTSPSPQEGKSSIVANLGISLAATGLQVILVDGDMRKPTLHQIFDLPNVFGLSDLLEHTTPMSDLRSLRGLQETGLPNLRLLPSGKIPLDPLTLLMSYNLSPLVEHLREHADIVILDSPPMFAGSDATVLAAEGDVSIFVVAHGITTRKQLQRMNAYCQEHTEFDLLGVVFNQIKLRDQGSYYYYYRNRRPSLPKMQGLRDWIATLRKQPVLSQDDPERLLGLSEAADALGITRSMARRWGKTGRLPAVKKGLRCLVRQGDLRALIGLETTGSVEQVSPLDEEGEGIPTSLGTDNEFDEATPVHADALYSGSRRVAQ